MKDMKDMKDMKIACDEAGHTGPDLLSPEQRHFSYASVNISDDDAYEVIRAARARISVQMVELKGAQLMKSGRGRTFILDILKQIDGRYAVNVSNKLLSLCGWMFEYIYEPVIQREPRLFYDKNLHRFTAMFLYVWITANSSSAKETLRQFQAYMRTKDIKCAPLLFDRPRIPADTGGAGDPFALIARFATANKNLLRHDMSELESELAEGGKWVLDLNASALWSHLNHWGRTGQPLDVICDVSKPLDAIVKQFSGDKLDSGIARAKALGLDETTDTALGWTLAKPIAFVDSRNHPSVQLADIVASAAASLVNSAPERVYPEIAAPIMRHMLPDSVNPDPDVVDAKTRSARVNFVALIEMTRRAEAGHHPTAGMAEFYHMAEVAWVKGELG